MLLLEEFKKAAEDIQHLDERPNSENLLLLYSLYKQGSEEDVTGERPSMMDLRGRAKYDAWAEQKGLSKDDAMQQYIDLVNKLKNNQS